MSDPRPRRKGQGVRTGGCEPPLASFALLFSGFWRMITGRNFWLGRKSSGRSGQGPRPDSPPSNQPAATSRGAYVAMLHEQPPETVLLSLDGHGVPRQEVLFTTAADLAPDGRLERHWLVLTRDRLVVLTDGPAPQLVRSLRVEQVESFRAHAVVGSGFLQARVDDV